MTEAAAGRPRVLSLVEIDAGRVEAPWKPVADVEVRPWTETLELVDPDELGEELTANGVLGLFVEADFVMGETFEAAPGSEVRWNMPWGYGSCGHRRRYRRRCGGDAYAGSQCRGRGGVDDRDDAGAVAGYPGNGRVRPGATLAGSGNRLLRDAGLGVGSTGGGDRWPGAHRSPDREVGQRFWGTSVGHGPSAERRADPERPDASRQPFGQTCWRLPRC